MGVSLMMPVIPEDTDSRVMPAPQLILASCRTPPYSASITSKDLA